MRCIFSATWEHGNDTGSWRVGYWVSHGKEAFLIGLRACCLLRSHIVISIWFKRQMEDSRREEAMLDCMFPQTWMLSPL